MLIVLVVRGVTLPGAEKGIEFYLKPDLAKLSDPKVKLSAYQKISIQANKNARKGFINPDLKGLFSRYQKTQKLFKEDTFSGVDRRRHTNLLQLRDLPWFTDLSWVL